MDRLSRTGRALHCDFGCRARGVLKVATVFSGNSRCNDRAVPVYALRAACFRAARVVQCRQWCVSLQCALFRSCRSMRALNAVRAVAVDEGGGQSAPPKVVSVKSDQLTPDALLQLAANAESCPAAARRAPSALLIPVRSAAYLLKCCGHSPKAGGSIESTRLRRYARTDDSQGTSLMQTSDGYVVYVSVGEQYAGKIPLQEVVQSDARQACARRAARARRTTHLQQCPAMTPYPKTRRSFQADHLPLQMQQ